MKAWETDPGLSRGPNEQPGSRDLLRLALADTKPGGGLVDVGAGAKWAEVEALERGLWYVSTDANRETNPDIIHSMGEEPLPPCFTTWTPPRYVFASHVLEHCRFPGLFLRDCKRIIRPGGLLFLLVPPWKPEPAPGHLWCGWNAPILRQLLEAHGFRVLEAGERGYNVYGFCEAGD